MITVRLPEPLRNGRPEVIMMTAATLGEVIDNLGIEGERDELYNFAVNGDLIVHGEKDVRLESGDEIEIVVAFSGG
ncbi:MAG TPA: MoaD/ThiS family protein [Thermoanaerobaculia bacterium]|nr:MoaD/ThiS family protein [Thermoanaerobaculia bacterium]